MDVGVNMKEGKHGWLWLVLLIAGVSVAGYVGNCFVLFYNPLAIWLIIIGVVFILTMLVHILLRSRHNKEFKSLTGKELM